MIWFYHHFQTQGVIDKLQESWKRLKTNKKQHPTPKHHYLVNNIWTHFLPSLLSPSVYPLRGRPSPALGARAPPGGGGLGAAGQHQSGGLSCQLCPAPPPPPFPLCPLHKDGPWGLHFFLCPIPSSVTFWCSLLGGTKLATKKGQYCGESVVC